MYSVRSSTRRVSKHFSNNFSRTYIFSVLKIDSQALVLNLEARIRIRNRQVQGGRPLSICKNTLLRPRTTRNCPKHLPGTCQGRIRHPTKLPPLQNGSHRLRFKLKTGLKGKNAWYAPKRKNKNRKKKVHLFKRANAPTEVQRASKRGGGCMGFGRAERGIADGGCSRGRRAEQSVARFSLRRKSRSQH